MAPGGGGRRRRWALHAVLVLAASAWPGRRLLADDRVGPLIDSLRRSRSFKVRVQAAAVLGRMTDPRVVPELARAATGDRNAAVRLAAIDQLSHVRASAGDEKLLRGALRRALGDRRGEVRAAAARAIRERERLAAPPVAPPPTRPVVVAVGSISDRTGRAGAMLRVRMRSGLLRHLSQLRPMSVVDGIPTSQTPSYVVDGTIARLDHRMSGMEAESDCAVQLIVSRPPRGIVVVVSGEAAVSRPRSSYRPNHREAMDAEALDHAVKSAHENVASFLRTAR